MLQKKYLINFFSMVFLSGNFNVISAPNSFYDPYTGYVVYTVLDPNLYYDVWQNQNNANNVIYALVSERNNLLVDRDNLITNYNRVVSDYNALYKDWSWSQDELRSLRRNYENIIRVHDKEKRGLEREADRVLRECERREDLAEKRVADRDDVLGDVYGPSLQHKFNEFEKRAEEAEKRAQEKITDAEHKIACKDQEMKNLREVHANEISSWQGLAVTAISVASIAIVACIVGVVAHSSR